MQNLLWKFVALAGVTGVGILVVIQAMQGLSMPPDMVSPSAASAQDTGSPSDRVPRPAEPLPPLETHETVALADPFSGNPPQPAADPVPAPPAESNPFAATEEPSSPEPTPAEDLSEIPSAKAAVDSPFDGSENASTPTPIPVEAEPPTPTLPELPVLVPINGERAEPQIEAFTDPVPGAPVPRDKEDANVSAPKFGNPTDTGKDAPFDPYEPKKDNDAPSAPILTAPEQAPVEEIEVVSDPENANSATVSSEIFAPLPEPADEKKTVEDPTPAPEFPMTDPEPRSDPLDQFPQASPETRPVAAQPGRASVEIPLAPPSEDTPQVTDIPPPPPAPVETAPPFPVPEPEESMAPEPLEESPFPVVDADPPAGMQSEAGPLKRPECAVPGVAQTPVADPTQEIAGPPTVDPLDQLTFPDAVPEHAKPKHHLRFPDADAAPVMPVAGSQESPASETQTPGPLPEVRPRPLNVEPNAEPIRKSEPTTNVVGSTDIKSTNSGPQQPKLKIEKTAPPRAVLNQPMIYHILVKNVGQSAARQVVVEDVVPQGTKLTGTIPRGEMADKRLIWRFDSLGPGEEKKISVRVIPVKEGQIGSVAKVSFVAEVASKTVVAAPKLSLALTGPTDAVLGDALTYHFVLKNEGSGDATKVFLRNILPGGLSHPNGGDLEYEVGTLKAGEKKEIDLTVNAAKAGEFSNKAVLSSDGGFTSEATAQVKILGDRLKITRTGPKRRYVGRRAEFSNTVVNQSEKKVEAVRVVEVVPAGMEFVKASTGGQFDPQTRTVTWALAELGPKENQLLTLELLAKEEGKMASQVTAIDPNGSRAIVKSETTVDGYTALRLDVKEYAEPLDVGEELGIRVVATNRGTRAGTNVVVTMVIPEEMAFVSAKGPVDFQQDGRKITFKPIPSLDARAELEFELVLKSTKAGDARLQLELGSDQTAKPLHREEGIRILATRP